MSGENWNNLLPTKRMDVKESHYSLMEERPEIVPRSAKFVRHVIHYGIYKDRGEIKPVKVFQEDEGYLIAKGHGLALAYHVLGMPFQIKVITPYDLMRESDHGNSEELRRAKNRLMLMHGAVKSYRKECSTYGINTLDDLLQLTALESLFEQFERARAETRVRTQEYDTRRIKFRRELGSEPSPPSFSDIECTGLEAETKEGVQAAKKLIFDYIKRRDGNV